MIVTLTIRESRGDIRVVIAAVQLEMMMMKFLRQETEEKDENEKSSALLEQGQEEIIDITGPPAIGECPKSHEQSQQHDDKATTMWREKESDEEENDHALPETDECLGLLPVSVHNPASALSESEETDERLGHHPVHNPAYIFSVWG